MRYERFNRPPEPVIFASPSVWPTGWRDAAALLAWVVAVMAAGATMGVLFGPDGWYATLQKPTWNPPNWLFGPVWTTLYALMGVSCWLVSREPGAAAVTERRKAWWAFALQALLNLAWTPLFFGLHSPGLAFVCITLLWLAALWMTIAFGRVRPMAGYLQLPLLGWISFALLLNGTIWLMNA